MIPNVMFHYCIVLLLVLLFLLCAYHLQHVQSKKLKYSSLFHLLSLAIYHILISLIRFPNVEPETAHLISQFIFCTVNLALLTFICFSIIFIGDEKEFQSPRFQIVAGGNILLMVLSFTGHIGNGVIQTETGYHSVSGEFRGMATIFYLCTIFYGTWFLSKGYKTITDHFTRIQTVIVIFSIVSLAVITFVCNALIPLLFKNSSYNFLAQFTNIGFLYTLFYVNLHYKSLFIKRSFRSLLSTPFFASRANISSLEHLLHSLRDILRGETQTCVERYSFQIKENKLPIQIFIGTDPPRRSENNHQIMHSFMEGYVDTLERQGKENLALGLQIQMAHEIMYECISEKKLLEYETARQKIDSTLSLMSADGTPLRDGLGPLEFSEKKAILQFLTKNNFRKLKTAQELGITINTLRTKMKKYQLDVPDRSSFHLISKQ